MSERESVLFQVGALFGILKQIKAEYRVALLWFTRGQHARYLNHTEENIGALVCRASPSARQRNWCAWRTPADTN